jgi:hypothetical protein
MSNYRNAREQHLGLCGGFGVRSGKKQQQAAALQMPLTYVVEVRYS